MINVQERTLRKIILKNKSRALKVCLAVFAFFVETPFQMFGRTKHNCKKRERDLNFESKSKRIQTIFIKDEREEENKILTSQLEPQNLGKNQEFFIILF